jgi:hypothetical protein
MIIALGFSRTNAWLSKTIRFFTGGQVSHVYIRVFDKFFKVPLILHSDWGGVQFDLAEKFDMENIAIEEYIIDSPALDDAMRKNLWHLGKGYAYIKLFNWTWAIILKRWFVRKVKDPIMDPSKLVCVDFALYILNAAGLTDFPIGSLHPFELLQWCQQNHEKFGWKRIVHDNSKTFFDHVKDLLKG